MFNRSIHQFWGIQALPFPERYFITSRSAEELAADMMSEVGGYQASDVDEYGCVYSQEHYVGCLRNSNITPHGQNTSGEVYMRLGKFPLKNSEKYFIPVYDFSDVHRHPARQRQGRGQHYQKNL